MIYLAVIAALALAALAYQQFTFSRLIERERDAAAKDREVLLQRIQDPHTAIAVQAQEVIDVDLPRHFVEFDDDNDFATAKEMLDS